LKQAWDDANKALEQAEKEYKEANDIAQAVYYAAVNRNDPNVTFYLDAWASAEDYAVAAMKNVTSAKIKVLNARNAYYDALNSQNNND